MLFVTQHRLQKNSEEKKKARCRFAALGPGRGGKMPSHANRRGVSRQSMEKKAEMSKKKKKRGWSYSCSGWGKEGEKGERYPSLGNTAPSERGKKKSQG